jgi:hypothetical protein
LGGFGRRGGLFGVCSVITEFPPSSKVRSSAFTSVGGASVLLSHVVQASRGGEQSLPEAFSRMPALLESRNGTSNVQAVSL